MFEGHYDDFAKSQAWGLGGRGEYRHHIAIEEEKNVSKLIVASSSVKKGGGGKFFEA